MESGLIAFIAIAVFAGALVQGLSGLGFPLVVSPVATQLVPGTGAVGLVNALSIVQNVWLIFRTKGPVAWRAFWQMVPGLVIGIMLGALVVRFGSERLFPVIVATSATASMLWLLFAHKFTHAAAGFFSSVWGGTVNTIAGVGGPPIASFLVSRGITFNSYVRTLQLTFAIIDVISLPILGVFAPSVVAIVAWLIALMAGSVLGELLRRRLSEDTAKRIGKFTILVVCVVALVRSVVVIAQG